MRRRNGRRWRRRRWRRDCEKKENEADEEVEEKEAEVKRGRCGEGRGGGGRAGRGRRRCRGGGEERKSLTQRQRWRGRKLNLRCYRLHFSQPRQIVISCGMSSPSPSHLPTDPTVYTTSVIIAESARGCTRRKILESFLPWRGFELQNLFLTFQRDNLLPPPIKRQIEIIYG